MSDRIWVDHWLDTLINDVLHIDETKYRAFEPTPAFYAKLDSGDENELASAAEDIGTFLSLPTVPGVVYEWGIRMSPETAGQIRIQRGLISQITIPLYFVGRPSVLGAILAHEFTHERLASTGGVTYTSIDEMERVTDLACVVLGLGKLLLNGVIAETAPLIRERQILGYVPPELLARAYIGMTRRMSVTPHLVRCNLSPVAIRLLDQV